MESIFAWRHGADSEEIIAVRADSDATVGDVAACLAQALPAGQEPAAFLREPTLQVSETSVHGEPGRVIPPTLLFREARLLSGTTINLCESTDDAVSPPRGECARARLTLTDNHVKEISLDRAVASVGSDPACDIVLEREGVEPVHAWIDTREGSVVSASDTAVIEVEGRRVFDTLCMAPQSVTIAGVDLALLPSPARARSHESEAGTLIHIPSSRFIPSLSTPTLQLPQAPHPARAVAFPTIMVVAPLLLAALMFMLLRSPFVLMFAVVMPVFALASYASQCRSASHKAREDQQRCEDAGARLSLMAHDFHVRERERAQALHPDPADVWTAARGAHTLLWSIPENTDGVWEVRVGRGKRPSRLQIPQPTSADLTPDIALMLGEWAAEASELEAAPVTLNFASGACAMVGEAGVVESAVRGVLVRMACMFSPLTLHLLVCGSKESEALAREAVWLPHVRAAREWSPAIAVDEERERILLRSLESLIQARINSEDQEPQVRVVAFAHAAGVRDIAAWMWVARHGESVGVTVLWWAEPQVPLPASCAQVLHLGTHGARLEDMRHGTVIDGIESDPEPAAGEEVSRALAPLIDARSLRRRGGEIPASVSLSQVADFPEGPLMDEVRSRWAKNDARAQRSLSAPVGVAADGVVSLSLVHDGPHALVAGTTGSGKSELLRSWVLSLAAEYSPDALTFLFIDYKGGAAFQSCADLPHCVGVVTDLSGMRVRRALTSLRAELRRREMILAASGVPDLAGLLQVRGATPLPALVIVIDEFAALVREEPAFMDELIDIAARGRSLGIHLILATQKPAGVVSGRIRANTSLRIALRLADDSDSHDVLGSADAASISPLTVGRAFVRLGPKAPQEVHIAYTGPRTRRAPGPRVQVVRALAPHEELAYVPATPASSGAGEAPMLSDAERILAAAHAAMRVENRSRPRRPWLEPLEERYRYEDLNADARAGAGGGRRCRGKAVAMADAPARQSQFPLRYHPADFPRVRVTGPHHAGRILALRVMLAAALDSGAHVYVVDSGGLGGVASAAGVAASMAPSDHDRCLRLFRTLTRILESRLARLRVAGASSSSSARAFAAEGLVLAVDSYAALVESLSAKEVLQLDSALAALVREGARVGIAVLIGEDRPREIPRAIAALIDVHLTFSLASQEDGVMAGIAGVLPSDAPAGRALATGWVTRDDGSGDNCLGDNDFVECQFAEVEDATFERIPEPSMRPIPVRAFPHTLLPSQVPQAQRGHWMLAVDWDACSPVEIALRGAWVVCATDAGIGQSLLGACMNAAAATHRIVVIGETVPLTEHDDSADGRPVLMVVKQCQARRHADDDRLIATMCDRVIAEGGMVIGAVTASEVMRTHPVTSRLLRDGNAVLHGVKDSTVFQVCQRSVTTPARVPEGPGRGWILDSDRARFVHFVDPAAAVSVFGEGGDSHE